MADEKPFVTIGGDAAGLSAASKARREAPDRNVIVFERGQWTSYAHCGTPYYVKGEVENLSDLISLPPAEISDRGIDLRRNHTVIEINPETKSITVDGPDGEFSQPYGDLLIGTGAAAVRGPFDTGLQGVFTLHGLDDAATIRAFLQTADEFDPNSVDERVDQRRIQEAGNASPPETAAIVGGGYVGMEMAEALTAQGLDVHLFQRSDRILPPFGEAVGDAVAAHLRNNGVVVHTNTPVDQLRSDGSRVTGVDPAGGDDPIEAGLVILGIGIRPNADLAADAGIELGDSGAIATDDYGCTNAPNVYAAGDCAEARHTVTGDSAWVPLGLTANRAGRAIGATVAGSPTTVGSIAGTAVVKAFDLGAGRTGLLDGEQAREEGFDPVRETITAGSRSGYYPGASETTVTMVADKESHRVLGASTVGEDHAAKRIDTVATALEANLTVEECERLDLGYAPPFSPVWDPILVASKVLAGSLSDD